MDKIGEAYRRVGRWSKLYDGMLSNSSLLGRIAMKYFWRLSDEKYEEFVRQAFAGVPDDFDKCLLEVPLLDRLDNPLAPSTSDHIDRSRAARHRLKK